MDKDWTWPFAVGDRVTCRGNWGPLVCDLRMRAERHPAEEYTVHAVSVGGRWLSVRDDSGRLYCHNHVFGPSIGPTYFRIAGECGTHCPAYSSAASAWLCSRCDAPVPAREPAGA